ncbi:MAG TPA: hypothetical protein VGD64_08425 [Acidisarcina sp.]
MSYFLALSLTLTTLPQAASQPGSNVAALAPAPHSASSTIHRPRKQGGLGVSNLDRTDRTPSPQFKAWYGEYQLSWARASDAQKECNEALAVDPANKTAIRCLNEAAQMAVDDQLNQADKLLLQHKPEEAAVLAAAVAYSPAPAAQVKRANLILRKAHAWSVDKVWRALPDWIRPIVDALIFIGVVTLVVRLFRWLGVKARIYKFLGRKTVWRLLPLRDLAECADAERATDGLLDSMARLGEELKRPPWRPTLLLLRPTPPADYEPAVISDFLSDGSELRIALAPEIPTLRTQWNYHEVRLDDAIQNLQLKAGANIDLGALLRFLMALGKWISAGKPTISGTVENGSVAVNTLPGPENQPATGSNPVPGAKSIAIHLAARGIQVPTISITTSSDLQPGIDCVQLAAERAAFKFLIRMQYPQMTNDEVNGHAALRQAASLFTEFAGTVPDGGPAAATRTSSLKSAARNFAFFRSSIPVQPAVPDQTSPIPQDITPAASPQQVTNSVPPTVASSQSTIDGRRNAQLAAPDKTSPTIKKPASTHTIHISDDVRQGALLAEGTALALTNDPSARNAAISCFRQLQEWPGSYLTLTLRQQAAYNEAIVRCSMGFYGQCVLMLTELLGDYTPAADGEDTEPLTEESKLRNLPDALQFAARLARLSAFAQYTREDWVILPKDRAKLLLDDGIQLVTDLEDLNSKTLSCVHDYRMARYMTTQAKRAAGHVTLQNVIQNAPEGFYDKNNRPDLTVVLDSTMDGDLERSTKWMCEGEDWSPTMALYCDIAESYLLRGKFPGAQAYARHATLQAGPPATPASSQPGPAPSVAPDPCAETDPCVERAFYLATESWYLDKKAAMAIKYAQRYTAPVQLEEFKALRTALGMNQQNLPSAEANAPVASTKT